ncbi:hypothetical protein YPPY48_1791 [Yersinia pestis PY-48]|nr:hypothetical protein YPPY48_1791 [Yersinia pestis PY-48]
MAITDKSEAIYGGGFTFPRKSGCSGIMKNYLGTCINTFLNMP